MQGLKVLQTIVDEIARVNEIVDRRMHGKPQQMPQKIFIQERFNELIYSINTIIKCGL